MSSLTAIIQTLALLGAAAALALASIAVVALALSGRTQWARLSAVCGASVIFVYVIVLLSVSVGSVPRVLPLGERKVFCEIDCHVVFSIESPAERRGDTVHIALREAFTNVSDARGNAPLTPGTRHIALVAENGEHYLPVRLRPAGPDTLFAPIRPGEQHHAELAFVVPAALSLRGLLVENDDPVSRLMIAHERSPLHAKVLLAVAASVASGR